MIDHHSECYMLIPDISQHSPSPSPWPTAPAARRLKGFVQLGFTDAGIADDQEGIGPHHYVNVAKNKQENNIWLVCGSSMDKL